MIILNSLEEYKKNLLHYYSSLYLMINELKESFSKTCPNRLFEIENENKEIRNWKRWL